MTVEIDHSGKVALVTGSGAGIGREIARWMGRAGAAVAVNDLRADTAEETVALVSPKRGAQLKRSPPTYETMPPSSSWWPMHWPGAGVWTSPSTTSA